jgi:antitoxin component of MazEF toxin-antitoxin module
MKKKIQKWGNSLVVVFNSADVDAYGLVEGDIIDISDMLKQYPKGHKKRMKGGSK